jgi:hypothetical protein
MNPSITILITLAIIAHFQLSQANFCKLKEKHFKPTIDSCDDWTIKIIANHPPQIHKVENFFYDFKRLVNCDYKICGAFGHIGVVLSAHWHDTEDCRPMFVRFAWSDPQQLPMFNDEIVVAENSVVSHYELGRFVAIFTCIEAENRVIDEGLLVFVHARENYDDFQNQLKQV